MKAHRTCLRDEVQRLADEIRDTQPAIAARIDAMMRSAPDGRCLSCPADRILAALQHKFEELHRRVEACS